MNELHPHAAQDDQVRAALASPPMEMGPPQVVQGPWEGSSMAGADAVSRAVSGAAVPEPEPTPDRQSTSATVLIVDDSAIDRRIAGHLIGRAENLGLQVVLACNGREALKWMAQASPAIVLTDLQMPEMDGLALVRKIRELHPEVPVVLMTAHGSEEIAIEAIKAGAASYVPKRSLARDLASTLRNILELSVNEWRQQRLFARMESREARFSLSNEAELHAPLIGLLQEDLRCMGMLDATGRIRVGVAIQEALNNAMYHGNLEVSSDLRQDDERLFFALAEDRRNQTPYAGRRIHVEARVERTVDALRCVYEIRDEGPGFDTSRLDRPLEAEDLMRVGGRGLLLIRAFMDQVLYNESGNQITMIKQEYFPLIS